MEHRVWDPREIQSILLACHLYDIDGMVRVPTREKACLYRYLEDGATGLMIPHILNVEQAQAIVQATKFPPLGDRGIDNAGLDSGYHANSNNLMYTQEANRETFLVLQIETPEAVRNCQAIAAVAGVDILFVGPGDLGLRLNLEGDEEGSRLEQAFHDVAQACREHGKAWGCPVGTPDVLRRRTAQGGQFLSNFGEFTHLRTGLLEAIRHFEP
jgi:2-keto-3-deoxy-L-rhamnonate aldolase RhmA